MAALINIDAYSDALVHEKRDEFRRELQQAAAQTEIKTTRAAGKRPPVEWAGE